LEKNQIAEWQAVFYVFFFGEAAIVESREQNSIFSNLCRMKLGILSYK
jgi:hypothetical protein